MVTVIDKIKQTLQKEVSIAPLVIFRIAFGALLFISTLRFILKNWVYELYIAPKIYFPFFDFITPFNAFGMYCVFALLLLCSAFILFGFLYRLSSITFFLLFTYVEIIDKTNYLNHYYFICLISFILIFLPSAKSFSLDNKIFKRKDEVVVPNGFIFIIKFQLFIVYFFAGVAKINYDWLINAMPLKIWLPPYSHWPYVGQYLEQDWLAYVFSWVGCLYDLSIGFLLFYKKTTKWAYVFVVIFHLMTSLFFNIGMFPYIMIVITIIFCNETIHLNLLSKLKKLVSYNLTEALNQSYYNKKIGYLFVLYFIIQIILPLRYLAYNQNLFWDERGYRFSWRVMLMEKAGTSFFYVVDRKSGREVEVDNKKYLTYMQEKQMSTQPDMIVDYAKFLKKEYTQKGFSNPKVRALIYVTLNGKPSKKFVNDTIDLCVQSNSLFKSKSWILN